MPVGCLTSEEIYDALVDDDCFAALPGRLAAAFGGRSALIHWSYPDGGAEILQSSGLDHEFLSRYALEFAPHDPWLRATDGGTFNNRALSLEEVVPASEYANSFFYNEFIRAMGDDTFRCLGVRVDNGWGSGIVAIHRGRRQHAFDPSAVAALGGHLAALRRMLAVRGRLAAGGRRLESIEAMLDHIGQAALLVRGNGALVHANALGEALLRRGDALIRRRGVLAARAHGSTTRLRRAIDIACAPVDMSAGALLVDRPVGRPLTASVVPLRAGDGERLALLIFEREARPDESGLRALYGLTRAEAEIAARIADGLSPGEIALERGVSVETVRSQVKALSAKLGCARQSEIVGLVKALPATNPAGRGPPLALVAGRRAG